MPDDPELLRRYAEERSEPAFAEFVQRHVDLVYSAAARRLNGDAHRAADVTQQVFAAVARHARTLAGRAVVTGWLYTATRNAAVDAIRREQRRQAAEEEARLMNEADEPAARDEEWRKLRPQLDAAMDELTEREREALLLRFFENRSYPEIGARCAIAADAARMRVDRALEKLRGVLSRQGVASTSAALAVLLAEQSVSAAPAGLAATVTGAALGSGAAGTAAGAVAFMSTTKLAFGFGAGLLVLTIGAATFQVTAAHQAHAALAAALQENAAAADRLRTAERDAAAAHRQLAQAEAARKGALAAGVGGTASTQGGGRPTEAGPQSFLAGRETALANGRKLLAEHPELQDLFTQLQRANLDHRYADFFAQQHFTPAQIAQFEQIFGGNFGMQFQGPDGPLQFGTGPRTDGGPLPIEQLRDALGQDAMKAMSDYNRASFGRTLAQQVAGAAAAVGAPLSADQITQVTAAFADKRPMDPPDWDGAAATLSGVLNSVQLAAYNAVTQQSQVNSEIMPAGQMIVRQIAQKQEVGK